MGNPTRPGSTHQVDSRVPTHLDNCTEKRKEAILHTQPKISPHF